MKHVLRAHFNFFLDTEGYLAPIQAVALRKPHQGQCGLHDSYYFWDQFPMGKQDDSMKKKSQQQLNRGATECTVKGHYYKLTAARWEVILHVLPLLSLIYADLFNRCLFSCLVPTSASRHPCRFERTRSHTLTPPPPLLDYSQHCGPNLMA